MKTKLVSCGFTLTLLITTAPLSARTAFVHPHGHKHGAVLDGVFHKSLASSGSSFPASGRDDSFTIPKSSEPAIEGEDIESLQNESQHAEPFVQPVPMSQSPSEELELRAVLPATPQSPRSRIHKRGSAHEHEANVLSPRQDDGYGSFVLGGHLSPSSASSAAVPSATSICPAQNGTTYTSNAGINYRVVCDIDFPSNDYPFQTVQTFEGCVQKCDAYNYDHHNFGCLAALFVPSREGSANDCYLKWSTAHPVNSGTGQIQGAIRLGYATDPTTSPAGGYELSTAAGSSASPSSTVAVYGVVPVVTYGADGFETLELSTISSTTSDTGDGITIRTAAEATPTSSAEPAAVTSPATSSTPGVTYSLGKNVITPNVKNSHSQGPTGNTPTKQYLDVKSPKSITLPKELLAIGVNDDLTTRYPISPDTGVLEVNISTQSYLSAITDVPHISRDGGKGGMVNGQHIFIFCDSGSYSTTTKTSDGEFLGFVSSSAAVDVGMNGLEGKALTLQDGIGQWSDNNGRMRGFAPLTTGELAYNLAVQGNGGRIAVWPESSIISLDGTSGIIYAPIVYDEVNEITKAAKFTYTGSTLLTITAGNKGGPVAERTVPKIFNQDEVEWGCAGGLRSWGPSGIGGDDGNVYLFGNVAGGLLLARVPAKEVADRDSFTYWNGTFWTDDMPSNSSTAYFIEGAFMDIDIFYSPRHLTFIAVYMTVYADSTFYYRYLEADQGILPPFAPGGDGSSDYVENILKYKWSEQEVLYKAAKSLSGKYIYSGGPHLGYFGSNDIINGGTKMLLSWTAPTGLNPDVLLSEYQIPTAEIDWA